MHPGLGTGSSIVSKSAFWGYITIPKIMILGIVVDTKKEADRPLSLENSTFSAIYIIFWKNTEKTHLTYLCFKWFIPFSVSVSISIVPIRVSSSSL